MRATSSLVPDVCCWVLQSGVCAAVAAAGTAADRAAIAALAGRHGLMLLDAADKQ
jgi:hypothetical protein